MTERTNTPDAPLNADAQGFAGLPPEATTQPLDLPNGVPGPDARESLGEDLPTIEEPFNVDPNRSISQQVLREAARTGHEDLLGLSWEYNDQTFVVRERDTVHTIVDTKAVVEGPPIHREVGHRRLWHRTDNGILVYSRRRNPKGVLGDVEQLTVDVYNQFGELEKIEHVNEKDLLEQLDTLNGKTRPRGVTDPAVTVFGWANQNHDMEPRDTTTVSISLSKDRDAFDDITHALESRNVTNWKGLTWNRPGGHKLELIRDTTLVEPKDIFHHKMVPAWVIKTTDAEGKVRHLEVKKDDDLRTYLNDISGQSGLNMRIEIPRPQVTAPESEETRALQEHTLQSVIAEQSRPWHSHELPWPPALRETQAYSDEKAAIWLLSYADLITNGSQAQHQAGLEMMKRFSTLAVKESKTSNNRENMAAIRRKEAVKDIIAEHGLPELVELALKLQAEYKLDRDKLHLPSDRPDDESITWIVESIADKYYFAKYPHKLARAGREYENLRPGDPFGDSAQAQHRRREIVDLRIGELMADQLITETHEVKQKEENGRKLFEEGKPVPEDIYPLVSNDEVLRYVADFIKERRVNGIVNNLLEDMKARRPIRRADYIWLGRQMRRVIRK